MKIEVGKKYRTREGAIVEIIKKDDKPTKYPFYGNNFQSYTVKGSIWSDGNEYIDDLIEEVVEKTTHEIYNETMKEIQHEVSGESAFNKQVDGKHYKKLKIQPMEYALANNLNYGQSNAIKYITRYKDKNGIEDLKKAIHCIELLIEFEEKNGVKDVK